MVKISVRIMIEKWALYLLGQLFYINSNQANTWKSDR